VHLTAGVTDNRGSGGGGNGRHTAGGPGARKCACARALGTVQMRRAHSKQRARWRAEGMAGAEVVVHMRCTRSTGSALRNAPAYREPFERDGCAPSDVPGGKQNKWWGQQHEWVAGGWREWAARSWWVRHPGTRVRSHSGPCLDSPCPHLRVRLAVHQLGGGSGRDSGVGRPAHAAGQAACALCGSSEAGGKRGRVVVRVKSVVVARGMSAIDGVGVQDGDGVEYHGGAEQQEMGPA
jgi:hypothetical protein